VICELTRYAANSARGGGRKKHDFQVQFKTVKKFLKQLRIL